MLESKLKSQLSHFLSPLLCTHNIAKSVVCNDTEASATVYELQSILFIYDMKEENMYT